MRRPAPIEVRTFGAIEELAPFAETLRELNAAGRRPSPFQTLEYLAVHLAHDEHAQPGTAPLFLAAFEGERLIGLLPMRRRPEKVLGARRTRLELLATHDADRPAIIARAEDEAACAEAFFEHVFETEAGWTMLELREQDAESPLHRPPVDEARHYLRHFPNNANATIELREGFEAWFRGLKNFRSNLARRTRHLVAAGRVEFIASADRRAARPFLDLESRSWKAASAAGIARHPVRIEKFRAMLGPEQPSTPLFHWLLLDGVPIAGMLSLCFADVAYQMELAFDGAYSDLSPGNVMFMLAVRDAVTRGAKAYNLLGNFAYHKSRWNAVVTETHAVQIYRRRSLHHQRALAGEWRRRVFGRRVTQADVAFNLSKPDDLDKAPPVRENRIGARERATAMLGALRRAGVDMQRFDEDALRAVLPFALTLGRNTAPSAA